MIGFRFLLKALMNDYNVAVLDQFMVIVLVSFEGGDQERPHILWVQIGPPGKFSHENRMSN